MECMFSKCSSLTTINLSSFKTDMVNNMEAMFCNCRSLKEVNLLSFNTKNVTSMFHMFHTCSSLTTINLSSFNASKSRTCGMFDKCNNLSNCISPDNNIICAFKSKM